MANKRQKPAEQLQGKGSRYAGSSTLTLVSPDDRRAVPAYPAKLPRAYHPVWDAFWADAVSQLLTVGDHYDVGRYFTLLAKRDRMQGQILARPTVEGSMGQPVVNPRMAIVKELTREIEKYREQLGILPFSRMRLGITANQFHESQTTRALRDGLRPAAQGEVIDLDGQA